MKFALKCIIVSFFLTKLITWLRRFSKYSVIVSYWSLLSEYTYTSGVIGIVLINTERLSTRAPVYAFTTSERTQSREYVGTFRAFIS